jgi:hypothetical protein
MNITSAKYDLRGYVTATAGGTKVSGIHPASRHWKHIQKWVDDGNTIEAADPPPDPLTTDELYDLAMQNQKLLKALALSLNDGTFVPGSGHTGAQLKTIIKANM